MIYTEQTKKAMTLAYEKHHTQKDKSGIPYIYHIMQVAEHVDDELSTTVALLHDIIEDTDTSADDLLKYGINPEAVKIIELMTKSQDTDYMEYIANIKNNPVAKKVKLADLKHNSNKDRLDQITEKDHERLNKYEKAIDYLKS